MVKIIFSVFDTYHLKNKYLDKIDIPIKMFIKKSSSIKHQKKLLSLV